MNTPRPAGRRFRAEAIPLALAALLAVSLPAYARGGHSGGGHSGGGHSSSHSGHSGHSGSPHGSTGRTAHAVPSTPGAGRSHGNSHGGHSNGGHFNGHGHFGGSRIFIGGFGYDPFFFNYYYPYGYWGLGGYWGPDYDPYYATRPHEYYDRDEMGALDLDVSPGRTHVFVDGEDLGAVDNFDGWPDYLWLPKGTYDVAFYLDGYKTIARQISVYPGNVIDIDDRMESGPSTRPEDLATKTHERRDERLSEERERSKRYEGQGEDEGWRDRVRRDRGPRRDDRGDYRGRPPASDDSARGRLVLDVRPEDASVYVDGRFVGTGSDLSMMRAGLPLAVGDHKLAIVRPGRQAQEKTFTVKAGEDVKLDVSLESGPG